MKKLAFYYHKKGVITKKLLYLLCLLTCYITVQAQQLPDQEKLRIGTNLGGLSDYGQEIPFVDLMRTCREWYSQSIGDPDAGYTSGLEDELTYRADGYPTHIPQSITSSEYDQRVATVWAITEGWPAGTYTVLWEGSGELGFVSGPGFDIISEEDHRITFSFTNPGVFIEMRIIESLISDPIHNIRVLMPGTEATYQSQPFYQVWLDKIEPFNAFRFMDWGQTNNWGRTSEGWDTTHLFDWDERAQMDHYTWASSKGIPYEMMIRLMNELDADGWVCVPHRASNDYIANMAAFFRDNLEQDRHLHVEYSNEIWNWGFGQTQWVNKYGEGEGNLAWGTRMGSMVDNCLGIWTDVYEGQLNRITRVAGVQLSWIAVGEDVVARIDDSHYDAITPSFYFTFSEEDEARLDELGAAATVDHIADFARAHMPTYFGYIEEVNTLCQQLNKKITFYEGGQHFTPIPFGVSSTYDHALEAIQRDDSMYDLYNEWFDMIRTIQVGDEPLLLMNFSLVKSIGARYGSWGILESMYQDINVIPAPKYRAVIENNAGYQGNPNPDTQPPTTPTNVTSSQITFNSVTLEWNASQDDTGVTAYRISREGGTELLVTETTAEIVELEANTPYTFTIAARDATGNWSEESEPLTIETLENPGQDTTAPSIPENLTATEITANSIRVSWDPATDDTAVTTYSVSIDGDTPILVEDTFLVVDNLSAETAYTFTVAAGDEAGNWSQESESLTVETSSDSGQDTIRPSMVTGLTLVNITANSLTCTWDEATDNVGVVKYWFFLNGDNPIEVYGNTITVEGLTSNTAYGLSVIALDAAGNWSPENIGIEVQTLDENSSDTTPPSIPQNLVATNITANSLRISWDPVTDDTAVTTYGVSINGASPILVTETFLEIENLSQNTEYTLTVIAGDAAGNWSQESESLVVTTAENQIVDVTPPSSPTEFTANNITQNTVNLLWNDATDDVGVVSYSVFNVTDNYTLTEIQQTQLTITDLLPATVYEFALVAVDATENQSQIISLTVTTEAATTIDDTAPSIPENLNATEITANSIRVSWDPATDDTAVTIYSVSIDGDTPILVEDTFLVVDNLSAETAYTFTVAAGDEAGNWSQESESLTVETSSDSGQDTIRPSMVTGLTLVNITANSLTCTWDEATDNVGVVKYWFFLNGDNPIEVYGNTITIEGLTSNTAYGLSVIALDAAGNWSPENNGIEVQTLDENSSDTTSPSIPQNLVATNITTNSLGISWDPATDDTAVTTYGVSINGASPILVTETFLEIENLSENTEYTLTVIAGDAAGNWSQESESLVVTTAENQIVDVTPPSSPTEFTANNITQNTVNLLWNDATDDVGVVSYSVFNVTDNYTLTEIQQTQLTITDLLPATVYEFALVAVDAAENQSQIISLTVTTEAATTIDDTAPSIPENLVATEITANSIRVSWDPATDDTAVTAYSISIDSDTPILVEDTFLVVNNLSAETAYTFTVTAGDEAGNWSQESESLTVETSSDSGQDTMAPLAPTSFRMDERTDSSIRLIWDEAIDNVGTVRYWIFNITDNYSVIEVRSPGVTFTGLNPATSYAFEIVALDAAGNISPSSGFTVRTLADGPLEELKTYYFGHSLVAHTFGNQSIPHWFYLLAQEVGYNYTADGQFGFLALQTLPPTHTWKFDIVPNAWDQTFAMSDFDNVVVTEANFNQYQDPSSPFMGSSSYDATLRVLEYVRTETPDIPFYIYENWPDVEDKEIEDVTAQDLIDFNTLTRGSFHDWWVLLQDQVNTNPNANVKLIPAGSIVSGLLTDFPALAALTPTDLFEDSVHGQPVMYFLTALVHYMSIYQEKPPLSFVIPSEIPAGVRANYEDIIDYIWDELVAFNDENGNSRVWFDEANKTIDEGIGSGYGFTVYPTIVQRNSIILHVEPTHTAQLELDRHITIHAIDGRKVHTSVLSQNNTVVSLENLVSGMYVMKIKNGKTITTHKLMVN